MYQAKHPINVTIFQGLAKNLFFENILRATYKVKAQFARSWKWSETML